MTAWIRMSLLPVALAGTPEERKAAREAQRDKAKGRTEEAKEKRTEENKAKREELKEKREAKAEENSDKREKSVDNRQERQAKRIEHGIQKGYLTQDEVSKLEAQQQSIATLEESLKADGKVTKDEAKQLQSALNDASRCIWSEKHDTDGNQMATFRLGKNVFAKDEFTQKMADENLTKAEARLLTKDFHRLTTLKKKLATDDLSADDRAKLQAEYNELLNKYFEVRA